MLERLVKGISDNSFFRRWMLQLRDARRAQALLRLSTFNDFERRIYSQNGEDGVISELFARIPTTRYFVEIGVEDGLESNAALLARHYGWKGLFIEGDPASFARLASNYSKLPVRCVEAIVTRENIASILKDQGVPRSFDLLSIDIDGNDYYVWEALAEYAPSVVVIEYNASFGATESKTIAYDPKHSWQKDSYYGASLTALTKLGNHLGYALVGTNKRGINAFFVRRNFMPTLGFRETTPQEAWKTRRLTDRALPRARKGEYYYP